MFISSKKSFIERVFFLNKKQFPLALKPKKYTNLYKKMREERN